MSDNLKILSYSVFDIDAENETHKKVELDGIKEGDLLQFIAKLAYETTTSSSTRIARFDKASLALKVLTEFADSKCQSGNLELLAEKLLISEVEQNTKSGHLNPIKAGSLIITRFKNSGGEKILVSKIEFESYLAKKTYSSQQGIPQKKGLLKSCLLSIKNDLIDGEIVLSDSNASIAAFWYEGFLEAEFIRDNILNTKTAIQSIESKLTYIKKISIEDYVDLKECVDSYFLSNSTFNFEDLKKKLTEEYVPKSEHLNLKELKEKLTKLKESNKFDGVFEIDKSEVKKNVKKTYKLDNEVTLIAKSGTSNIYRTIKDNAEYILIKTNNAPKELKEIQL